MSQPTDSKQSELRQEEGLLMKGIDVQDYLNWVEDAVMKLKGDDKEVREQLIRLASQIIADLKLK